MPVRFFNIETSLRFAVALAFLAPDFAVAEPAHFGPYTGYATIVSVDGADTRKAVVRFRSEQADLVKECVAFRIRMKSDDSPKKLEESCSEKAQKNPDASVEKTRSADCARLTVRMEWDKRHGDVFALKKEAERLSWKNLRTGAFTGRCPTCDNNALDDTFRLLCPKAYRKRASDLESGW